MQSVEDQEITSYSSLSRVTRANIFPFAEHNLSTSTKSTYKYHDPAPKRTENHCRNKDWLGRWHESFVHQSNIKKALQKKIEGKAGTNALLPNQLKPTRENNVKSDIPQKNINNNKPKQQARKDNVLPSIRGVTNKEKRKCEKNHQYISLPPLVATKKQNQRTEENTKQVFEDKGYGEIEPKSKIKNDELETPRKISLDVQNDGANLSEKSNGQNEDINVTRMIDKHDDIDKNENYDNNVNINRNNDE